MTTKHMLIIKDAHGAIIGAQIEDAAGGKDAVYITPAQADHTLYRVSDVPAEILGLTHPDAFHKAITDHVKSGKTKVTRTSAEELQAQYAPLGKKH